MKLRLYMGIAIITAAFAQNYLFAEEEILKYPLEFEDGDSYWVFRMKIANEAFYGKNNAFLNDANGSLDKVIIPLKWSWDGSAFYGYGRETYGYDLVTFQITARLKATAGDPDSIASTAEQSIKIGSIVTGAHIHKLQRMFPWVRQLEFNICLTDAFALPLRHKHYFTAGAFPFELGRGISLGSAYAVDPDSLGYYSDRAIDQFAPGFLFSGSLLEDGRLSYGAYIGILDNRSDTFDNVNLFIRGNECDHEKRQARGFGVFDYLIAARLKWKAFESDGKQLVFEPYALYDNDREQKVVFLGDAESKLGTFGLAMEYTGGRFEAGFEVAHNIGHQNVKCIDRDVIELENRNGQLYFVHSQIEAITSQGTDIAGKNAVDTPENQAIIDLQHQENSSLNGKPIDASNLRNSKIRFRNAYRNNFKGSMFIADASYWLRPRELQIAYAVGFASGDQNPHQQSSQDQADKNHDYEGFIGLQEKYSGTRVKSAFILAGSSSIPRLLTVPETVVQGDPFPLKVARFTNLIFTGGGLTYKTKSYSGRSWNINPNILTYWTDEKTKFNDPSTKVRREAARHLGIELNIFADTLLLPDLKLSTVFGLFIAGQHYEDIKGIPLDKNQQKYLNSLNDTGNQAPRVPLLGADKAYFFNAGFEYRF